MVLELFENYVVILQPITISALALTGLLEKLLKEQDLCLFTSKVETSFVTMWITLASRLFKSSLRPDQLDDCTPLILQGAKKTLLSPECQDVQTENTQPLTYWSHQFKWADICANYYNRHKW